MRFAPRDLRFESGCPGRGSGRVRVPAPEGKQGIRPDIDDRDRADGVARPAGGDEQGAAGSVRNTSRGVKAVPLICPAPTVSHYPRTHKSREVGPIKAGTGRRATRPASLLGTCRAWPILAKRPLGA